jgi:hypothetical protein
MKPIVTHEEMDLAQPLCGELLRHLSKLPPKIAMTALAMTLVFAADAADETPLESVFQMMRIMRKGFTTMQSDLEDARARGEAPSQESGLVAPTAGTGRIIVP